MYSEEARWIRAKPAIKKAIRNKGNRYGNLSKPLIIAVNTEALSVDREDEVSALFGDYKYLLNTQKNDDELEIKRVLNGVWINGTGPVYQRVSGAWLFNGSNLWDMASCTNTLYHNPWANLTIPDSLNDIYHAKIIDDEIQWFDVKTVEAVLGLEID